MKRNQYDESFKSEAVKLAMISRFVSRPRTKMTNENFDAKKLQNKNICFNLI